MAKFFSIIGVAALAAVALGNSCTELYESYGLSHNFNETIAHAIHSITLNELRKFNPLATERNGIPVVNPAQNDATARVLPDAPLETTGNDFNGETMNTVDMILSQIGGPRDSFGSNWSPLARIIHSLHMKDVWAKIKTYYDILEQPGDQLCQCLRDTKNNGIYEAVDWAARNYQTAPLFRILNRPNTPVPTLTDAKSWAVWKVQLLHYYNTQALYDAATYLRCALY